MVEQTCLALCDTLIARGLLTPAFKLTLAGDARVPDVIAELRSQRFTDNPRLPRVDLSAKNPPFKLAEQFIRKALDTSNVGVAMIARAAFLEGVGRYCRLCSEIPPDYVLQFTERVVMHKGRPAPEGSTANTYAWLIWFTRHPKEETFTRLRWIAPCRKRLERTKDYAG